MTPVARPDPVAALVAELIEEGLLTAWTDAPGDKELADYNQQAVSRIVAQMAEHGYVLVNVDMLERALNAAWIASNDAVGHQLPPDLAPHLFAALNGPAR